MAEVSARSAPDLRSGALAAEALLRLDAARQYGFLEGGPAINVDRCEEVIAEAAAAGLTYTDDEILFAALAIVGQGIAPAREHRHG